MVDSLLVEICPDIHDEYHDEQDNPSGPSTHAPGEALLVKQETNGNGSDHLSNPVQEVVEGSAPDIEQCTIVFVELCGTWSNSIERHSARTLTPGIEPITDEEHREESDDPRIGDQRLPQTDECRPDTRVAGEDNLGAIRAIHLLRTGHAHRNRDTNESQDQESDLQKAISESPGGKMDETHT